MKLEIKKKVNFIDAGDLVMWNNSGGNDIECLVCYDGANQYCWSIVPIDTFNTIESWDSIEALKRDCSLIAKSNKLKLVVEE